MMDESQVAELKQLADQLTEQEAVTAPVRLAYEEMVQAEAQRLVDYYTPAVAQDISRALMDIILVLAF